MNPIALTGLTDSESKFQWSDKYYDNMLSEAIKNKDLKEAFKLLEKQNVIISVHLLKLVSNWKIMIS